MLGSRSKHVDWFEFRCRHVFFRRDQRRKYNPKNRGETIVKKKKSLADASPDQVDAAVDAAAAAFQTWSRTTPAERSALLLKLADAIDRDAEGVRRARGAQLRQAAHPRLAGRDAGDRRLLPLLRRRRAQHARAGGRRVHGRPHLDDPPRSDRRGRLDRAVELPADDGGLEARAGARRRQHHRDQAVRADPAHHAEARQDHRRHLPRRRGECRHRPRRRRPATH